MRCGEVCVLGGDELDGHHEVTFALLVSVIADDDHLAAGYYLYGVGNVDGWIFHVYCLCTEIAVVG